MNPIISPHIRIRHPDLFHIGKYSIVDDFCYFSTKVEVGICSHIASGCSIAGGRDWLFTLGNFSSLSSGVKIWCTSNDFTNDLVAILPDSCSDIEDNLIQGDVAVDNYCGIGANTVIMPDNNIPQGVAIGALSFVPAHFQFKPWSVYAGAPIRYIKPRNKLRIMEKVEEIEKRLNLQRTL
jgi:acetyltransferase-like isoleucine patch superfamily enzyme